MGILIDSSVWIRFLNRYDTSLDELIPKGQILIIEVIFMELYPFFQMNRNVHDLGILTNLEKISLTIDWDQLIKLRLKNLQNGINKVGIADLLILQQALQHRLPICSLDKHFKLMQPIFGFELVEG